MNIRHFRGELCGTHVTAAMANKSDGYKNWLSKQHTGFCGTRLQTACYTGDEDVDNCCPSCEEPRETAAHVLLCPDEDRTCLLQETTEKLESWMNNFEQHV